MVTIELYGIVVAPVVKLFAGTLSRKVPSRVSNSAFGQKSVPCVALMVVPVTPQGVPGIEEGLSRIRSSRMIACACPSKQVSAGAAVDVSEGICTVGSLGRIGDSGVPAVIGLAFLPTYP